MSDLNYEEVLPSLLKPGDRVVLGPSFATVSNTVRVADTWKISLVDDVPVMVHRETTVMRLLP